MLRLTTLVLVLTFVIDTAAESSVALRSRDEAFARQLFADVISMDTSVIKANTQDGRLSEPTFAGCGFQG